MTCRREFLLELTIFQLFEWSETKIWSVNIKFESNKECELVMDCYF